MGKTEERAVLARVTAHSYPSRPAAMRAMRDVVEHNPASRKMLQEAIDQHYPKLRGRSLPTLPREAPPPPSGQLALHPCLSLKTVKVDVLGTNPAQPPLRTSETALAPLLSAIKQSMVITPPMVAADAERPGSYIIGDGHRRVEAARELGVDELQVCIYDIDDVLAFWVLCNVNRPVRPEEWLASWAVVTSRELREKHLSKFPSGTRRQITRCLEIWGEDRLREIGREGRQSPAINTYIFWLSDALRTSRDTKGVLSPAHPLSTVGDWMVKHHMHRRIVEFRTECSARANGEPDLRRLKGIHTAIRADEPWNG